MGAEADAEANARDDTSALGDDIASINIIKIINI